MPTEPRLPEELGSAQCWQRLRSVPVGRIAFVDERTGIEVFPVNFLVDRGTIVFRTAVGTKLAGLATRPPVAFEADGIDAESGAPWSVVAHGSAEPIDVPEEIIDAFDIDLSTWNAEEKPYFVRVLPTSFDGRISTSDDRSTPSRP